MKLARAGGGGGNKNLLFAAPRPGYIGLSAYTLFPDFMLQCFSCEAKRFMSFARESWSVPYYFDRCLMARQNSYETCARRGRGGNKNLLFAAPRPGYIGLSA